MSHIENTHKSIETLANCICMQLSTGMDNINAEEMSQATDMLKDLAEAEYYCTIVNEMKEAKDEEELINKINPSTEVASRYYNDYRYSNGQYAPRRGYDTRYPEVYDPANTFYMNKHRLGYDGQNGMNNMRTYTESGYERAKRGYSESRMIHNGNTTEDKNANIASLDEYVRELTSDITEMIKNASPEEKAALRSKITTLATKF